LQILAIDGKLTNSDIDLLASLPPENQEDSVRFLQLKRGKIKVYKGIQYRRKPKPKTSEVNKMAAFAMKHGCENTARALYWTTGGLSTEEFIKDITNATRKNVPHRKGTYLPPEEGDN
jgi:hypothetical protein